MQEGQAFCAQQRVHLRPALGAVANGRVEIAQVGLRSGKGKQLRTVGAVRNILREVKDRREAKQKWVFGWKPPNKKRGPTEALSDQ